MDSDLLLVDFASRQPREMANLLAAADTQQILELLAGLPYTVAAQLAACLPGQKLRVVLRRMEPSFTASLLLAARHEQAIALVSHLSESAYAGILAAADRRSRGKLTKLFDVPLRSVAAHALPDFFRVMAETRGEDLANQLAAESTPIREPILVVNDQGVFVGEIHPTAVLLSKNRGRAARDFAERVQPLNGRISIDDALKAAEWKDRFQLPVVDGKHRLLGIVRQDVLRRYTPDGVPAEFGLDRVVVGVASWYLAFCEHALKLLFARRSR